MNAAVTFGTLLLVNKVYSPQYMLWLFVFAVLGEWPVWSLVLMALGGLVDYADAMTALYLSHTHSPAFSWFFRTLYPWNRAQRNGSIGLALCGAVATFHRQAVHSGLPRRLERSDQVLSFVQPESLLFPNQPAAVRFGDFERRRRAFRSRIARLLSPSRGRLGP